jgi:hypothetical protein
VIVSTDSFIKLLRYKVANRHFDDAIRDVVQTVVFHMVVVCIWMISVVSVLSSYV